MRRSIFNFSVVTHLSPMRSVCAPFWLSPSTIAQKENSKRAHVFLSLIKLVFALHAPYIYFLLLGLMHVSIVSCYSSQMIYTFLFKETLYGIAVAYIYYMLY